MLALTIAAALHGAGISWALAHGIPPSALMGAALAVASPAALTYYVKWTHSRHDFVIEELDGLLIVDRVLGDGGRDHHRYTYNRKQRIRATRNNLRLVEIRSHWSGQSRTVEKVTSLYPEHRLLDGASAEDDGRIHRWVYLLGPIARNRRVRVGIKEVFEDAYAPMKPYYRESGEDHPVQKISVRVRFAYDDAPFAAWHVVWKQSKSGSTRQEVSREPCRPIIDPRTGSAVYEMVKVGPESNCAYGICWRWPTTSPDGAGAASLDDEPTPVSG
jgi:hypothetical protein